MTSAPIEPQPSPARRADAERNRARILAVARAALAADETAQVSMAEIARRAGVGMATLYRNFPGRRELLEALYTDEVDALCADAAAIGGETPGAAFVAWLRRFVAFFTSKRRVAAELLDQTGDGNPVFGESRARVLAAGQPLLVAAQRSNEVRADLSIAQVMDLIGAVAAIPGDTGYIEPILQAAIAGLRPPGRDDDGLER